MGRKKKELPLLEAVEIMAVAAEGKAIAKVRMRPDDEGEMVVFIPLGSPGDVDDINLTARNAILPRGI